MKLISMSKDWGDEFDVHGLIVLTDEEYADWVETVNKNADVRITYEFGTNESWSKAAGEFFNSDDFTVETITEEEGQTIINTVGKTFGTIPTPWEVLEEYDDEDFDEDQDY